MRCATKENRPGVKLIRLIGFPNMCQAPCGVVGLAIVIYMPPLPLRHLVRYARTSRGFAHEPCKSWTVFDSLTSGQHCHKLSAWGW